MSDTEQWRESEVEEARRWRSFMEVLLAHVPEVREWLDDADPEWPQPLTPGAAWQEVVSKLLDEDAFPRRLREDIWPRLLAFIEVVHDAIVILEVPGEEPDLDDDATTLDAFAVAGILHDVTRNRIGLERLLPWMGAQTVTSAKLEVEIHDRLNRDWGGRDIDWSSASASFASLDVPPQTLLPLP